MSSSINWQNLRAWGGSQQTGFEELCCQLASYEKPSSNSKYERKGAPDAGIECLWIQPDGKKHGWQSKYFLASPDNGQWAQLDKSVQTALTKHPELITYTVCLPTDREDPRIPGRKSFMDKWNERVAKWQQWANEKEMSVEFRYWGESEIIERLAREEHRGRYKFWFEREWLTQEWFQHRLEGALRDAEPRYSPELNVELPIAKIFDGLGRTEAFFTELATLRGKIGKCLREATPRGLSKEHTDLCKSFFDQVQPLVGKLCDLTFRDGMLDGRNIEWREVEETVRQTESVISKLRQDLESLQEKLEKEENEEIQQEKAEREQANAETDGKPGTFAERIAGQHRRRVKDVFDSSDNSLYRLERELRGLLTFAESSAARLFNEPQLLIHSKAGKGKTHLLCDVAKARIERREPTVVLLGEKFTTAEPWNQILQILGLNCTRDEFLGAMEAAAQARGGRALIFIDALNEGEGITLWRRYLAGLLAEIERFPHVGIAISVRSTYTDSVIPESVQKRLVSEEHQGFSGHEYKATSAFFNHYGIALPTIPLLHPEWSDPLFLRLFCQGLQNAKMTTLPEGWHGITRIFNFFLNSINRKLFLPERLDFDPEWPLVRDAALLLAQKMSEQGRQWLPKNEAQKLVDELLPRSGHEKSLFRNLLAEGVLTKERFLSQNNSEGGSGQSTPDWEEGVRFGFERFYDHLHARYLLDTYFDPENPEEMFSPSGKVGCLFTEQYDLWGYKGLLEALAIQVPERQLGLELPFLLSSWTGDDSLVDGFLDSLLWRTSSSITEETRRYINEYVVKNNHEKLLDVFLTLASRCEHPYNAEFLHNHLMKFDMAERDSWWSIYLHEQSGNEGAIDRLLDWAQSLDDKSHISDESVQFCATTLAWFLTTSNRFVRDRATKGLVALLWERLHLLQPLLQTFDTVNDPYVCERLLAACYGCCLRSSDNEGIAALARHIFHTVFKSPRKKGCEIWPHILGRDYARGVIELALHRGLITGDEAAEMEKLALPPYGSSWPDSFPDEKTNEELLKEYSSLWYSLSEMGDFGRYVVDSGLSDHYWSVRRLGEDSPPTLKERANAYIEKLSSGQLELWEEYQSARDLQRTFLHIKYEERVNFLKSFWGNLVKEEDEAESLEDLPADEVLESELSDENLEKQEVEAKVAFKNALTSEQLFNFELEVEPYLQNPYRAEEHFQSKPLLRWIAQRVFELGWTKERFALFDDNVNHHHYYRNTHKAERIGKKYQWIALHEIAARVADNFYLIDKDNWPEARGVCQFDGPWHPSFRDIDPSIILRETKGDDQTNSWWAMVSYTHWYGIENTLQWLQTASDLPAVEQMVEVLNRYDGQTWLSLDLSLTRYETKPPGEEGFPHAKRGFWFMLKSYLIHREDREKFWQWGVKQHFMGRWMPECSDLRDVFWGELFWAPSFRSQTGPYYGRSGWTAPEEESHPDRKLPVPVLVTVDKWVQDGGDYDCSLDESARIVIPCQEIARMMKLRPGPEGEWLDEQGKLIAFDPSTNVPGPSTLLIKKDIFLKFLDDEGYDLVWTLLGEKQVAATHNAPGVLEISGVLRLGETGIECEKSEKFIDLNQARQ